MGHLEHLKDLAQCGILAQFEKVRKISRIDGSPKGLAWYPLRSYRFRVARPLLKFFTNARLADVAGKGSRYAYRRPVRRIYELKSRYDKF